MKQSVTITGENLNVVVNNASEQTVSHKLTKAEQRIAALKATGIDTSMYFPMGDDHVIRIVDGAAIPVDMEDDVERRLVEGGYINHYKLFRRWVMAQMFRILRRMEERNDTFNAILQLHGYEYSWRMLENELLAQCKMYMHGDTQNFSARNRWFNDGVASDMASEYISSLRTYIENNLLWRKDSRGNKVAKHTCKGVPYVRLRGRNIFVSDLESKVFIPLRRIELNLRRVSDPHTLYTLVREFNKLRKPLPNNFKQSTSFIDAYKGSGAYFTMRNLILFHGARFSQKTSESSSLDYLELKAREYTYDEGWRLLGVMKQLIKDSNISVQSKLNEWCK